MTKIAVLLGTRPEVIKLYPVVKELKRFYSVIVVNSGQQEELTDQMLKVFGINVDRDLAVMDKNQHLSGLTAKLHLKLAEALESIQPDLVIVQGDTTTAFVGALEAFYHRIPVAHVEAGLRTDDIYSPFPEEVNRRLISQIATYNFAPTPTALDNLNGVPGEALVTGNTAIDTLLEVAETFDVKVEKQVLVTLHRRESFGRKLEEMLYAILTLAHQHKWLKFLIPLHPNPNVFTRVLDTLGGTENIKFTQPLEYPQMVKAMKESLFIMTDSGGIQEEAPSLNKPVLVLRDKTERPEGVEVGALQLVGTETDNIVRAASLLIDDPNVYNSMINKTNPYGDGRASERISKFLRGKLWPN